MLNTIKWNLLLCLAFICATTALQGQDVREKKLDREIDRKMREIELALAELKRLVAYRAAEFTPVSWELLGIAGSTVPVKTVPNRAPYISGVRIDKIVPDSEAAKMKLKVGDIVVEFEKRLTETHDSLVRSVNTAFNLKTSFPEIYVVRGGDVHVARIGER